MDRMRESLFSRLGDLSGSEFLDLFSGSGVMSLEAASRGAQFVCAVERDVQKRSILERNLTLAPSHSLKIMPVEAFIQRHKGNYHLVFLDPPFNYKYKNDILCRLINSRLLSETCTVCIHHPRQELLQEKYWNRNGHRYFLRNDISNYGQSQVTYYSLKNL